MKLSKLVLILIALTCSAYEQLIAQIYPFNAYTVEDGLSQNQVLSICQGNNGYMWFGTNNGGVTRYDGRAFKTYNTDAGLAGNIIYSVSEYGSQRILLGTNSGLTEFKVSKEKTINYTTKNNLPHDRVFSILHDSENNFFWIGTEKGVATFKNGIIETLDLDSTLNSAAIFTMYQDSDGFIWFGTLNNGVFMYNGNKIRQYDIDDGLPSTFVRTIIQDDKGNMWFGTTNNLSFMEKGTDKIESVDMLVNDAREQKITTVSSNIDAEGNIWFGTEWGLFKYDGKTFSHLSEENGLPDKMLWCSYIDREGNHWIGSQGKGVFTMPFNGRKFANYNTIHGLVDENITSVFIDEDENKWIGSNGNLCVLSNTGKIKKLGFDNNERKEMVAKGAYATIQRGEDIWVGTYHWGLFKFNGDEVTQYKLNDLINPKMVYTLEMFNDYILAGTGNGIIKIDSDDRITKFDSTLSGNVFDLYVENNEKIWIAMEDGLRVWSESGVKYYSDENGFINDRVKSIVKDWKGNMWFATNLGLYTLIDGEFEKINIVAEGAAISIFSILNDNRFLWIGTNKGIYRLDLQEYYSSNNAFFKQYGKLEGFMGVECNLNAATKGSNGKLWFGTVKGVTVYNPKYDEKNELAPITNITNIRYEFDEYDWKEFSTGKDSITNLPTNLELPHDKSHLTFDFIGISLTVPEKVRYKYILEPLDKDWTKPTQQNEAVYSHIPPGNYTFKVKAMNNDGVWNKQSVDFTFTILPPWYQTWWFYTLCVLLIGGGIYTYITVRTKALQRQKKVLEDQVNQRTAQLREEKEKVEEINQEVIGKNMIIQAKNKDIMDSINYAKRIQDAMLPAQQIMDESFNDSFVLFKPKDVVSGDFYWARKVGNKILFAAADCTGHGVPGAFVSIVGTTGLNRAVNEFGLSSPADILDQLHEIVAQTFMHQGKEEVKDGMDIALCSLNIETRELEYAGANNPLYLVRDGEVLETKANKQPIGGTHIERVPFVNHVFELKDEDTVYIFSDGYADQFGGPIGKKFKYRPFRDLIVSMQEKPLAVQQTILNKEFEDWRGEHEQIDDVCVIGIKI